MGKEMSRGGFSFGDHTLYRRRVYYRGWIDRTLFSAWELPIGPNDCCSIMQLKDSVDPPKIEDPGLIGSSLQKHDSISRRDNKMACLMVMIINLIQVWHKHSEEHPEHVEDLLTELDNVIEEWEREEVIGSIGTGFKLRMKA